MQNRIQPYSPCPCGSGKKYKFCCYLKAKEASTGTSPFALAGSSADIRRMAGDDNRMDEGLTLLAAGVRRMNASCYEDAIGIFKQVMEVAPIIHSAANNMALCLMVTGQLEEAIRVQMKCLTDNSLPNPFGLANLVTFFYITGDEFRAHRYLKEALRTEAPSEDACVKVCEVFARFKQHQKILDYADSTPFKSDGSVCFYTGVAAANLGDSQRAIDDLGRVPSRHHKSEVAKRYLTHLRKKEQPHTLRNDWPYLFSQEIFPVGVGITRLGEKSGIWKKSPALVDFCEAMLNEAKGDQEDVLKILEGLEHPGATELLHVIAKGSFGPDSLRMQALNILKMHDKIDLKEKIEILLNGEKQEVNLQSLSLNYEFRFGAPLPPKLEKLYVQIVETMQAELPDWKLVDTNSRKIANAQPDFYPAQFNYAVSLHRRGHVDEAVLIVRDLVEKYPEYLFARSALLQFLIAAQQNEEAATLVESEPQIAETHPHAWAAWMAAMANYYLYAGERKKAFNCAQSAHQIAPTLSAVRLIWEQLQEMEEEE